MERSQTLHRSIARNLITGGMGFIGSHLCEALIGQGHTVLCVDNFQTGSLSNVAHLVETGRFELKRGEGNHWLVRDKA